MCACKNENRIGLKITVPGRLKKGKNRIKSNFRVRLRKEVELFD